MGDVGEERGFESFRQDLEGIFQVPSIVRTSLFSPGAPWGRGWTSVVNVNALHPGKLNNLLVQVSPRTSGGT